MADGAVRACLVRARFSPTGAHEARPYECRAGGLVDDGRAGQPRAERTAHPKRPDQGKKTAGLRPAVL